MDQLRLFKRKHDKLNIFVDLQTAFPAKTHPAQGQRLKEEPNVVKLHMFLEGTQMPTVYRTRGQYSVPLKAFIKNNASK
jgi:hypothetical protein